MQWWIFFFFCNSQGANQCFDFLYQYSPLEFIQEGSVSSLGREHFNENKRNIIFWHLLCGNRMGGAGSRAPAANKVEAGNERSV